MEYTKTYFETLELANQFIEQINSLLGIPVSEDAITRTYTEPQEDENGIYVEYESNLIIE